MKTLKRYHDWRRQAVIVRRRHVMDQNGIFGLAIAASLILAILAVQQLNVEREARLQLALEGQLTASDIKTIAKRTARLESPTDIEIVDQITKRLKTCLAQGGCRQTIRRTIVKVLDYVNLQQGPAGPSGRRGATGSRGRPGQKGTPGRNGKNGQNAPATEIVQTPTLPNSQIELNARLLQDLDTGLHRLDARVDRLDTLLKCILTNPLNILGC
jgi:hypothetical protein